jgi:hypothetical protein
MERIGKPFLQNGLKLAIDKIMQRGWNAAYNLLIAGTALCPKLLKRSCTPIGRCRHVICDAHEIRAARFGWSIERRHFGYDLRAGGQRQSQHQYTRRFHYLKPLRPRLYPSIRSASRRHAALPALLLAYFNRLIGVAFALAVMGLVCYAYDPILRLAAFLGKW